MSDIPPPWEKSGGDIDEFIAKHLRPDENLAKALDDALDTLINHIRTGVSYSISRTRRCGSLAKLAHLKENEYEFELILFIGDLRGIDEHKQRIDNILKETRDIMDSEDLLHLVMVRGDGEQMIKDGEINIRVMAEDDWFQGKVIPTVDLLGVKPSNATLETMYRQYAKDQDKSLFYPALRVLYTNIIQSLPQRVRDLILLLKYWAVSRLQLRGRKPPAEFWEVLAIGRWTMAGSPEQFNSCARGLYDILECFGDWHALMITWETSELRTYSKKLAEDKRREVDNRGGEQVPVILDPVDPQVDYTYGIRALVWGEMARAANDSCGDKLFEDVKRLKTWQK